MVAAWKGEAKLAQNFLMGSVAVNIFLVLGLISIGGGNLGHQNEYPTLMTSMHARAIVISIVLACIPTASAFTLNGKQILFNV